MNALHIAKLDLFEKRMVLGTAALLGLLIWAVPFLPAPMGGNRTENAAVALIYTGIFMLVMAFIQGATMLATDLKERRLGFFLNRPMTATALWSGKVLGGILLVFFLGFLTVAPSVAAAATEGRIAWWDIAEAFGSYLGICALVLVLAHALSVTARARTGWIFLLVGLLGLWGWILRLALIRLVMYSNDWSPMTLFLTALGTLGLAFAFGGWFQVAQGRTDLQRSARLLALAVAAGALVSMGTIHGYTVARTRVGPEDLVWTDGGSAPSDGGWVALEGRFLPDQQLNRAVLFNSVTGKYLVTDWRVHAIAFSEDGTRAAWVRNTPSLKGIVREVVWADLTQTQPAPRPTGIRAEDVFPHDAISLSRDGGKVAFMEVDGRLRVHALASGTLLASTRMPGHKPGRCFFLDSDRLRYYSGSGDGLEIGEFDLKTMRAGGTGRIANVNFLRELDEYNRTTDRMLLRIGKGESWLCEARTGRIQAVFPAPPRDSSQPNRRFLWDGSLVEGKVTDGKPGLSLLDDSGQPLRTIDLSPSAPAGQKVKHVRVVAQLSPTRLVVEVWGGGNQQRTDQRLQVDLSTERIEPMIHGLPLRFDNGFGASNRLPAQGRIFRSGQELLRFEEDGSRRVLVTFNEKPLAP